MLVLFIAEQYIVPLVMNTIPLLQENPVMYAKILERCLKLSIPCTFMWLLSFYGGFHLWLNILGELLRFADRTFYEDWWNSRTMGDYWRLWNKPIHTYLVRHVFIPIKLRTKSSTIAMLSVFFVSAVAHEYFIGGACHILTYYSFLGMIMQIPCVIGMELFKAVFEKS
jgi:diacylglycerol O-acyltransferase-1